MFEFFRIWLIVVGAALAAGGVALTVLVNTPVLRPFVALVDAAFWPAAGDGPDAAGKGFRSFVYGVCGGTMAGWGLTIAVLVSQAFGSHQAWVWWSLAAGVALWFVLDTGRSLRHRVWPNAAANTALLVVVAIPLAGTFGEFH